jgi:hypothetical protein
MPQCTLARSSATPRLKLRRVCYKAIAAARRRLPCIAEFSEPRKRQIQIAII